MGAPNFDRSTITHTEQCDRVSEYMSMKQFTSLVAQDLEDVTDPYAKSVIIRCFRDISPFDIERPNAYYDACTCAINEVRARRQRSRMLENASRSRAPASRNAPIASMPDLRNGAEDVGEYDALD